MRNSYTGLTAQQLRQAASISDKIASLQSKLNRIFGKSGSPVSLGQKRKVSASTKAKMAAAAKARWARVRAGKN
jgi:hypothetical protein